MANKTQEYLYLNLMILLFFLFKNIAATYLKPPVYMYALEVIYIHSSTKIFKSYFLMILGENEKNDIFLANLRKMYFLRDS